MRRNLDLSALRALAAIADFGGVTRAAQLLNLTQSAVSMQIKRLEESLGLTLLDRSGRGVSLTSAGEQLLGYARRIIALNDEAVEKLTDSEYEGEITVIVPHDIVYPHVPQVLRHFHSMYPRMQVTLLTQNTSRAKESFARGECDLILTTEMQCEVGGKTLTRLPLLWIGAPNGQAWRQRPLRLAQGRACAFRAGIVASLDRAGIPWETAVESESDRTLEAAVSCDMAIHALLAGTEAPHAERIAHGGALPELSSYLINLYVRPGNATPGVTALAELLEKAWDGDNRAAIPMAAE
ncbi:LysR family transcriptional regulator [Pararhodobacter sp. CCB-MM2]|uniref:LysR family transcriptional regulator n=1 Tax=Pararhodobacter sp. CCB-MM2 TaxID=1786003 RepID=UPI00082B5852|nr:LysR family transcriptional regulator [Pararhodobacter sp. CCB-MM2]MCA2014055.1 LysR family transcriptional regulator [Cereibacter sphaeroides]